MTMGKSIAGLMAPAFWLGLIGVLFSDGAIAAGMKPVDMSKMPLHFETVGRPGQEKSRYLARGSGYRMVLSGSDAAIQLSRHQAAGKKSGSAVIRMRLVGANDAPAMQAEEELPGKVNYLLGKNPGDWRTNVPTYGRVRVENAYPGIDVVYYGNQGQLEYDFIVAPGTDPSVIAVQFDGAEKLELGEEGDLLLHVAEGAVRQQAPVIYQRDGDQRVPVKGHYELIADNRVGFSLGDYDASRPLVIDPILSYSTYVGGKLGAELSDNAIDPDGNMYITGKTGQEYPTTPGAFQETFSGTGGPGGGDVYVTKLNADGSGLVYSTYLGTPGRDEPGAIAVDAEGHAYVVGNTGSNLFPVTAGAAQPEPATRCSGCPGHDGFVTKLAVDGASLVFSTYLGGDSWDGIYDVAVGDALAVYVTGNTRSSNFPVTPDAWQAEMGGDSENGTGDSDAFVTRIDPTGSTIDYSTYVGGRDSEDGSGIATDKDRNIYIVGRSGPDSPSTLFYGDFPTTPASYQPEYAGGRYDSFVVKFDENGAVLYSTYVGGTGSDNGYDIAAMPDGSAYLVGWTDSADYPVSAFPAPRLDGPQGADAFITQLDASGSDAIYSTYFGGSGSDVARSFVVSANGRLHVTGETSSADFPTTPLAFQPVLKGRYDAFLSSFNRSGTALLYSTYIGGTDWDFGNALATDDDNNLYLAGETRSVDFPVTPNAYQKTENSWGDFDAFALKFEDSMVPVDLSNLPPTP